MKECSQPRPQGLLAFQKTLGTRLRVFRVFVELSLAEILRQQQSKRVLMGWWLLRLSAKILALLRLSVNFLQLRLTKKLKINFFCFKKLNIN